MDRRDRAKHNLCVDITLEFRHRMQGGMTQGWRRRAENRICVVFPRKVLEGLHQADTDPGDPR